MPAPKPLHRGRAPTVAEVTEIASLTDPVLRNLKITQGYHELKLGLVPLLGEENLSWCGYTTWASKTAGKFIRGEHLPLMAREVRSWLRPLAGEEPPSARRGGLTAIVARVSELVAAHVAEGNRMVFAEMAPLYADLIARFSSRRWVHPHALRDLLAPLRPGPLEEGGQEKLIEAFTFYHEAMFERDAKARAELILLGNLLVAHHEQARLQGPIAEAMNAPLTDGLLGGVLRAVTAGAAGAGRLGRVMGRLAARASSTLESRWRRLLTQLFMTLELPSRTLQLAEDLPRWSAELEFPAELVRPRHPRLIEVIHEIDRTPHTVVGSAARDWGLLADRMNYVADLFRTRQHDRVLYDQPFTYMQAAEIARGRLPHGAL
jgi:hypothetical protein